MIVDDGPEFLDAARRLLEQEGIDVVGIASSGDDAVRLAHELRPDVTLVDIDLGAEDGIAVARSLATTDGEPAGKLILISTHGEDEFADLIQGCAAIGFVAKSELSADAIRALVGAGPAMGLTRAWRSTLAGTAVALVALTVVVIVAGYALAVWFPEALLQLVIGALLLIFGLQWLRKAVLRSAGLKSQHDEAAAFEVESAAARGAARKTVLGLDWFAFVVSFKGVFLEGLEVVFIVLTFGISAGNLPLAATGAAIAGAIVLAIGAAVHRPLSRVPENTLKFGVGILLSTFGTFWAIEGLGVFSPGHSSLEWPSGDLALVGVLIGWIVVSRALVAGLRRRVPAAAG